MDSVSLLLLVIFLFVLVKILIPSGDQNSNSASRGGSRVNLHAVSAEMIETVSALFPQISRELIRRDLAETGNSNLTIDRIIENRGLFSPSQLSTSSSNFGAGASTSSASLNNGGGKSQYDPLSSSFKEILAGIDSKERPFTSNENNISASDQSSKNLKMEWSQDPVQRATQLRLRKERMLLEARQKFQSTI